MEQANKNEKDLERAAQKINDLINDSNTKGQKIQEQYEELKDNKDEMEKIRLEVTVVMTEKGGLKKELDRVNRLYTKL